MTETVDTRNTYGKGLLGRIQSTLLGNILPLVGGEFDGRVAKFDHFTPFLPPYPFAPQSIEPEAARLNIRLPKVLNAMLLSNSRRLRDEAYIEAIGGEDFGDILKIAMRTAVLGSQDPKTAIRLVYGGTNQMPLRALSGVLNTLVYMENLRNAGVTIPQLQVIFADHISSSVNSHIPFAEATQESEHFARLADEFIKTFFPNLTGTTVFLRDSSVEVGTILGDELAAVSTITDQVISESRRAVLVSKRNNGNGANISYGAAHLLVHDIALPGTLVPILDGPVAYDPEAIISIGGRQEQLFYRLRHEVKPYLPEKYRRLLTFQLFTRHQVPPYYMANDGDIALGQELNLSAVSRHIGIGVAARYDLEYLIKVCSTKGDLHEFLQNSEVLKYEKE